MPNSPPERRRVCDFCSEATAIVFCRADSAKLCLACDKEVHATAQLFTKHTRRLLCDSCDSSPAVIVCSTHGSVLCQNCDFELHDGRPLGSSSSASASASHDRGPLEGFSGQPTASEIATFLGLQGLDCSKPVGFEAEGLLGEETETRVLDDESDFWFWDTVTPQGVVSVDELIVSGGGENHGFQAMVDLDTLPKDRNSTCGQHKLEMIRQLCLLAKSETDLHSELLPDLERQTAGYEPVFDALDVYEGYQHDFVPLEVPGEESLYLQGSKDDEALNEAFLSDILFGNSNEEIPLNSDKNSEVGNDASLAKDGNQGPSGDVAESGAVPSKTATPEIISANRGSALSRYKEKKRSRRYEKHIRYESRKTLAESRIRIKGRFAKVNEPSPQIQS